MHRYFIFYKPFRVLCQFSPEGEKVTLAQYFADFPKNIYPVGRLDFDSEGLLILTDDKQLTHQLLDPKFAHNRTYLVQVEGQINDEAVKQLSRGVIINVEGKQYKTKPAIATILNDEPVIPDRDPPIRYRQHIPTSWISLTLTEGKNRQVRKMTASVGFPTLRLVRYSIGNLNIGNMQPGECKELSEDTRQLLFAKQF